MAKTDTKETEVQKLAVGETVEFVDYVLTDIETRFGETQIVSFADNTGKVFRKCFAQGGMIKHLTQNPGKKSITLAKKLIDGDRTLNVWA